MGRVVKAALLQTDWAGSKDKMIDKHEAAAREAAKQGDEAAVREEVGDLLFAVVNVARHLKVDPEDALRRATAKFRVRFEGVEALARERGIDLHTCGLETLDTLWDEVKAGTVH